MNGLKWNIKMAMVNGKVAEVEIDKNSIDLKSFKDIKFDSDETEEIIIFSVKFTEWLEQLKHNIKTNKIEIKLIEGG
jgi:hypothetical protein